MRSAGAEEGNGEAARAMSTAMATWVACNNKGEGSKSMDKGTRMAGK